MKKNIRRKRSPSMIIMLIIAVMLTGNLIAGAMFPGYAEIISERPVQKLVAATSSFTTMIEDVPLNPASGQGGVNLRQIEKEIEGQLDSDSPEPAPPPAPKPEAKPAEPAPRAGQAGITQEQIDTALKIFQDTLRDRDVIALGQQDLERPYLSEAFRDNPFDEVHQVDIRPILDLDAVPPPPFFSEEVDIIDTREWDQYVKTLVLVGIIKIDGDLYAYIKSGPKEFIKREGEDFRDRFTVTVEEISIEAVLLSNEFGNKAYIDYNYRHKFQVQPIDNVTYITNLGIR